MQTNPPYKTAATRHLRAEDVDTRDTSLPGNQARSQSGDMGGGASDGLAQPRVLYHDNLSNTVGITCRIVSSSVSYLAVELHSTKTNLEYEV